MKIINVVIFTVTTPVRNKIHFAKKEDSLRWWSNLGPFVPGSSTEFRTLWDVRSYHDTANGLYLIHGNRMGTGNSRKWWSAEWPPVVRGFESAEIFAEVTGN